MSTCTISRNFFTTAKFFLIVVAVLLAHFQLASTANFKPKLALWLLCILNHSAPNALGESTNVTLRLSNTEIKLTKGTNATFNLHLSKPVREDCVVVLNVDNAGIVVLPFVSFLVPNGTLGQKNVSIQGEKVGHVNIAANTSLSYVNVKHAVLEVRVYYSSSLDVFSDVIGWIYFVCWTVSFYPQIYENFKRKSVIGLNFDYLSLNFMGHTCYNIFNIGLFWITSIQMEYKQKYPRSQIPVQPNDVGFSMHAMFATAVTIIQALIYERGGQRVSYTCISLMSAMMLFIITSLILSIVHVLSWLDFLYFVSYVKLAITLLKCCPQAYLNFKRKSTEGWSIGNVLLDFTGGSLSIMQMFLISYNFDDWASIFGDPTKFGLGLFSILFDVLFVIQHYVLYRNNGKSGSLQNLVPHDDR